MDRAAVLQSIDSERVRQEGANPNPPVQSVGDYLRLLRGYANRATAQAAANDEEAALEVVQRIATLAVKCLEEHSPDPEPAESATPVEPTPPAS
jgi:hypothetical protein